MDKTFEPITPIQVTNGPKQHFFGYYDKQQWDMSNRYLLSNEADFLGRSPSANDTITLGMIDTQKDYEFIPISTSRAWCWQQGTMLQWVPGHDRLVVHNDRIGDRFVSVVIDIKKGRKKVLPRPIYAVSNDGKKALSLNFSRLAMMHPGYGYNGLDDWKRNERYPSEDGIYLMDMETGEHKLVIDLDMIVNAGFNADADNSNYYFNHLLFSPTNKRFIFLHRWPDKKGGINTRLCTADTDGGNIFVSDIKGGSHFIWYDDTHILIWAYEGNEGKAFYLIEDVTDNKKIIGEGILTRDGHCTISSDKRWILTDEYPGANRMRPLILYNIAEKLRVDIGSFYSPPDPDGEFTEFRCDLHPRWNRDDSLICIDSEHTGERQMHIIDVSGITKRNGSGI